MIKTLSYHIQDIIPYINWTYFFYAWKITPSLSVITELPKGEQDVWIKSRPKETQQQAKEALDLYQNASKLLLQLSDEGFKTFARFGLFPARSKDDDIYLVGDNKKEYCIPLLRQQHESSQGVNLCLSDFINPNPDYRDTIGLFTTSIQKTATDLKEDLYQNMLVQTVYDRLAEATCERMHEEIRKRYWGYAPLETLNKKDLFNEKFQGIRPAIGYPSLPDQSISFIIEDIIKMSDIGVHLTENGAMIPHSSVCGFMFSHPQSHYFNIGKIGQDQFKDYVRRRGLSIESMRKFLAAVL